MSRCPPPLESSPKKPPRPPPTDPPSVWSLLQIYCRADCCTGSRAAPLPGRQLPVHTQPFAFRAPQEDDESVKMTTKAPGRSSTPHSAVPVATPGAAKHQDRQFLFSTSERPRVRSLRAKIWSFCVKTGLPIILITGGLMTSQSQKAASAAQPQATAPPPTVEEARQFTDAAEKRLLDLWIKSGRAQWVQETFITDDTEILAAQADQNVKAATSELAAQARTFEPLDLPPDVGRKLKLIKLSVDIPSPRNPKESTELSQINASLQSDYGKGKWCPDGAQAKCLSLNDLENIMANSRDPVELQRAWIGWHAIAPPMRERYSRMVELANEGAREVGFR